MIPETDSAAPTIIAPQSLGNLKFIITYSEVAETDFPTKRFSISFIDIDTLPIDRDNIARIINPKKDSIKNNYFLKTLLLEYVFDIFIRQCSSSCILVVFFS